MFDGTPSVIEVRKLRAGSYSKQVGRPSSFLWRTFPLASRVNDLLGPGDLSTELAMVSQLSQYLSPIRL